jgi:pyrroloquinoline quinone (PQQ) biosynthesis protein C
MTMALEIRASGTPAELLASDAQAAWVDLAAHPTWAAALSGTLPRQRLIDLILAIHPAVAGAGRYIFAAKVSQIAADDGAELFRQLYTRKKVPEADADKGWRAVGSGLGIADAAFDAALARPSPEAEDYIEIVREHGLARSPAEAAVVAWVIERQLPALWGGLAEALVRHYGVAEAKVAYLRWEAARRAEVERWVAHLVDRYVLTADPYEVFAARRAGREAAWAWTALTETVA